MSEIKIESTESEILTYLKGGTPLIWINTKEGIRVQKDIINELAAAKSSYQIMSWDSDRGTFQIGEKMNKLLPPSSEYGANDPHAAIQILRGLTEKVRGVMFMHNIHAYIKDMLLMQMMLNSVNEFKSQSRHLIFLCPSDDIPIEIRDYVTLLKFPLPDESRIEKIIEAQLSHIRNKYPEKAKKIENRFAPQKDHIIAQARGLSAFSVEQAISQSLVLYSDIRADKIFEEKRQMVAKSAALDFMSPKISFNDVGGYDKIKVFLAREIKNPTKFPRPKGVMMLGVPGCGKSLMGEACGYESGLPVLSFDFAKVYRGIVGESESTMANVIQVIDAVAPCIVVVDEIEKGLSGVQSSAKTDGGVGDKVGSIWLKWMSSHTSPVIVIGTCNSIDKLPPEYLRAGRWDGIFFVDLPNSKERGPILNIHCKKYGIDPKQEIPDLKGYTGAEIEQICITAARFEISLKDALEYVIPISRSAQDQIDHLRTWATGRALMASTPDDEQKSFDAYNSEGRSMEFLEEE